jgi:polyhydroxybutyrate depolymerase
MTRSDRAPRTCSLLLSLWALTPGAGACGDGSAPPAQSDAGVLPDGGSQDMGQGDGGQGDAAQGDAGQGDAAIPPPVRPACVEPGQNGSCALSAYPDRPYLAWVPASHDGLTPIPVVIAFHGGGGSAEGQAASSCPDGDTQNPSCLHSLGGREGFATIYPNGTATPGANGRLRTWNAGGGTDGYECANAYACEANIDDMAYVRAILDDLAAWLPLDPGRVYATGLSNGGAITHRVGCELADRIVAIAPIGSGNQFSTAAPCNPSQPVGVLDIHATTDPCWLYVQGPLGSCLGPPGGGTMIGSSETMAVWAAANGCTSGPTTLDGPERVDDGIRVEEDRFAGCRAPVRHFRVIGGGHTWVSGFQYLPVARIGTTYFDLTNEDLWNFFDSVRR